MNEKEIKEIIDGANAMAIQYFTAYNQMLQLTGNSEEAIRLTISLFEAVFAGNRPRPEPWAGGFMFTGIGGKTIDRTENETD